DERRVRTSSYTIFVDLPDSTTHVLLAHGYTGAFDKVSVRIANYLRSLQPGPPARPLYDSWTPEPYMEGSASAPSEDAVKLLQQRGYLTSLTIEEEYEFCKRIANILHTQ